MMIGSFALSVALVSVTLPANGANTIIPKNPIKPGDEPVYDTATVIDVMAKVTDIWEVAPFMPLEGVHLAVKSGAETLDVYVAPVDFVKMFGATFKKGDRIEVIGSRVMYDGGDVVLASEIRMSDVILALRDRDGTPYWKSGLALGPTRNNP